MFEFQSLTRQREDTGHVFLVDVRLHTENGHVVFRDALLAVIDDVFFAHVQGAEPVRKRMSGFKSAMVHTAAVCISGTIFSP